MLKPRFEPQSLITWLTASFRFHKWFQEWNLAMYQSTHNRCSVNSDWLIEWFNFFIYWRDIQYSPFYLHVQHCNEAPQWLRLPVQTLICAVFNPVVSQTPAVPSLPSVNSPQKNLIQKKTLVSSIELAGYFTADLEDRGKTVYVYKQKNMKHSLNIFL